ncbi:hypothetical protein GCM10010254_46430 [Streptomyces chromofuscus]|nr:hypothetical protein GCM10010254_46430 [Streptomyces chromofuscus]
MGRLVRGPLTTRGAEAAEDGEQLGAAAAGFGGGEDDQDEAVGTVDGELVRVQAEVWPADGAAEGGRVA